jgi:threonine dehydrogenase-like Zn-dependent dehydrogenase
MKAVAVLPKKPNSVHLVEIDRPSVSQVPNGRGVLVRLLRVGIDGTDREINAGLYGDAPEGSDFLILGHESFGEVVEVGPNVHSLRPGDLVVATVRRPGSSVYDAIGTSDMTTDETFKERGISQLHGFLTESYVDSCEFIVKVPEGLREVGVLLEPFSIVEKGIAQAFGIQQRLLIWQPRTAAVMGAGSIGLLAALALRLRGLRVTTFARSRRPNLSAELAEAIGAVYESTQDLPVTESKAKYGAFDLIFEATGLSAIAFESMQVLA